MSGADNDLVLSARGIRKRFPGVTAVDGVDLDLSQGEILALLGQNGAGKSTLIQILAGVHAAGSYEGTITVAGAPYAPKNVANAERAGIAMVPQEVNVCPDLTVAQNMYLGAEPSRWGFVDQSARDAEAAEILARFGVDAVPEAEMGTLDLATQQLVLIARALSKRVRVLILDEPTTALTRREAERLFDRLRSLKAQGVASIFVSHRLTEVFTIADRVAVMRDGRMLSVRPIAHTSRERAVEEMIGRKIRPSERRESIIDGGPMLAVERLVVHDLDERRPPPVDGISINVHGGEVLGLYGLLGAGCTEALLAIFGAWPGRYEGVIRVQGDVRRIGSPADAIRAGIGLVAQDRRQALMHDRSIADNIVLASLPSLTRLGFVNRPAALRRSGELLEALDIKAASVEAEVGTLSGGNQQKVQIARWLATESRVLLLIDPTRGVDIGARVEINRLWRRLAADGHAILLVSSEAEELAELCDRVLILVRGRIEAECDGDFGEHDLLAAAAA